MDQAGHRHKHADESKAQSDSLQLKFLLVKYSFLDFSLADLLGHHSIGQFERCIGLEHLGS